MEGRVPPVNTSTVFFTLPFAEADAGAPRSLCSIPISPDRPIEDNYLDAYLSVLKGLDPLTSSVLINCGMGVVRTTFAMTAACIVRRHQFLRLGLSDPFAHTAAGPSSGISRTATPSMNGALSPPATPFGSSLAGSPALVRVSLKGVLFEGFLAV